MSFIPFPIWRYLSISDKQLQLIVDNNELIETLKDEHKVSIDITNKDPINNRYELEGLKLPVVCITGDYKFHVEFVVSEIKYMIENEDNEDNGIDDIILGWEQEEYDNILYDSDEENV